MKKTRFYVVVLALVAATVAILFGYKSSLERTNEGRHLETKSKIAKLNNWCDAFRQEHGRLPEERIWCRELVLMSLDDGDFLDADNRGFLQRYFYDAWDRPLRYRIESTAKRRTYVIYSTGPNKVDDDQSQDDIIVRYE